MCSNNFEAMHVSEMGLKLLALDLEPFLYTGTTVCPPYNAVVRVHDVIARYK